MWIVECFVTTDGQTDRSNIQLHVARMDYPEAGLIDLLYTRGQAVGSSHEKLGQAILAY